MSDPLPHTARLPDGLGGTAGLPTGSLTFLFTDIEGSTSLWERHPREMGDAIARHDRILRQALEEFGGRVFKTVGDAFHAVFPEATSALDAALAIQRRVRAADWPIPREPSVRVALHAGTAELRGDDYFGPPLNRVARILAAGHGGQVLLSRAVEQRVGDRFPEGAALRDLGDRRLKDLADPERIFQLVVPDLPAEFPPLRTLDERPHNLPAVTTPLVGRERDVEEIRRQIRSREARLVTLLGPGGTGKTRLALQVAADSIDEFRDGVWLVNLAPMHDPALVGGEILRTLGARTEGDEAATEALLRHVSRRQVMLLLDNFEQVVDAAPLVRDILEAGPESVVLVTSQAALRIRGEHEFPVAPLAAPSAEEEADLARLAGNDCVALFVQRATEVVPSFRLDAANGPAIAAICREVDGLPLAIELAAARVKIMTPAAILERLRGNFDFLRGSGRDVPDRHLALRKTIDWSYGLLDQEEAAFFRRQAVFDGGYTLEAAEAICTAPGHEIDAFEALTSLVDKSLVRRVESGGEARFERLRTIRAYAVERLEESGEADLWRRRHAEWFARLSRFADYNRSGDLEAARWLNWLEREIENVRAAFQWAVERGEAALAVRFCKVLPAIWFTQGGIAEGRRWLEATQALDLTEDQRADILNLRGRMAQVEGDNSPEVVGWFEESLALYERTGDRHGAARARMNLGNVHRRQGEFERARERFEASLETYRDLRDAFGESSALMNLGDLANALGDVATARRRFEESRDVARRSGAAISLAYSLEYLGTLAGQQGDFDEAEGLIEESRGIFERLRSEPGIAWSHYALAVISLNRGELAEARSRLAQALAAFRRLDYAAGVAVCLLGHAALAALEGRCEGAVLLLGASTALHRRAMLSLSPTETGMIERVERACGAALGETAFAAARRAGEGLTMESALALVTGVAK